MDRRRHFQNPATFYTEDMKSEGTKTKNFVKSIYSVIDFTEFLLESWHSVEKREILSHFFSVKTLLSRNFVKNAWGWISVIFTVCIEDQKFG